MGANKELIHTGIDSLVQLVEQREKLSFKDAAKLLGVSLTTVEEWAHFLAEEGVIDVAYNFRNPMLIRVQLSSTQKTHLKNKMQRDRDAFHRRLESTQNYFEELDRQVHNVDKIVDDLDEHLENQLSDIRNEMRVLQHLEQEKVSLHEQMLDSKKRVDEKIKVIDKHLADEKIKYKTYREQEHAQLAQEAAAFQQVTSYLQKVKADEQQLEKKLSEVKEISKNIEASIQKYARGVIEGEKRMNTIKAKHESLVKDLEGEYKTIQDLLKKNENAENIFKKKIEQAIQRIEQHEKIIDSKAKKIENLPDVVQSLLQNKSKIHDLIATIKHEETEIESELENLRSQSKILEYKVDSDEYKKIVIELNARLTTLSSKRTVFEKKIESLISLIGGKLK